MRLPAVARVFNYYNRIVRTSPRCRRCAHVLSLAWGSVHGGVAVIIAATRDRGEPVGSIKSIGRRPAVLDAQSDWPMARG